MKNSILKGISLGCIGLIFACNEKKAEPTETVVDKEVVVDKEGIKKEIQSKEDAFAEVYNSGQLKNIGYYADDATSYFQNRPPLVGKEAIITFLKDDVVSSSDRISFKTNEVFVSNDGNMVVEIGSFKVVDSVQTPVNTGHYMTLFEKRNGKYVAVRDMSASDQPIK